MSKNIKIGNNTLTGVTTIKLEDADTSGTYDSFVDTTDADATADNIISTKTAYVNGTKLTGTFEVGSITEALNMANGNQVITATSGDMINAYDQITITKPATLIAENIKKDVVIGGVTGTYEGGVDLNIHYSSTTAPSDTSKLWVKTDTNVGKVTVTNDISGTPNGITTLSTTLPTAAFNIGTAAVGTKIYLFGGSTSGSRLNTIQVFDTTTNTRTTLSATLPTAAYGIGTAAVGTKIYLFGGSTSSSYLNTIQVFDTTTNTRTTLSATLPTAALSIGTAAVGTKIYLFGGSASGYLNTINCFTVIVSLPQNELALFNALGTADEITLVSSNTFDLKIKLQTALIGNSSNQGDYVQIARYNGSSWVDIN